MFFQLSQLGTKIELCPNQSLMQLLLPTRCVKPNISKAALKFYVSILVAGKDIQMLTFGSKRLEYVTL